MKSLSLLVFLSGILMITSQAVPSGKYKIYSPLYSTYWDTCIDLFICTNYPVFDNLYSNPAFVDSWQDFHVTALPNGYYTIMSDFNSYFVTAANSANPTDTLFMAPQSNSINQEFAFIPREGGTFLIKPRQLLELAIESSPNVQSDLYLTEKDCKNTQQYFSFIGKSNLVGFKMATGGKSRAGLEEVK